jgi:formate-dependent nitrite reductase cytochrome c552 subunit
MSDIFPKWTNRLPRNIIICALLVGTAVTGGVTYYFTPKYTRVGYEPIQPVAFPHSVHVTQLGLDCRYCHNGVEKSWYSNIPATSVCMNCHNQVLKDDPRLAVVRESAASGKPIEWVQIHKLPDYAYFNHSVHVNRGVSCVECHGQINHMDEVYHAKPLSMSFCLDCHRNPAMHLRKLEHITDLDWKVTENQADWSSQQLALGEGIVRDWHVQSLQNCSTCHR